MKKIAVSACLLGESCRYDGTDNRNDLLLSLLEGNEIVPFCPEDFAFGTPRPTMDLVKQEDRIRAISNESRKDLSDPVIAYAQTFFESHPDIDLFIGKDRSPSCGVCTARCYDAQKHLISDSEAGLMAKEAQKRGIETYDAQRYVANYQRKG